MQKECFSLPAIKATMTLFLYSKWGKKYIYISLYINIYTQMWLGCSNSPCCWQGGTTQHWNTIQTHGSLGGRSYREPWEFGDSDLWAEMEDHRWAWLQACMRQSFTGHLQRNNPSPIFTLWHPLTPWPSPSSTLLLSQTLLSAFAIWSVFISIITYPKSKETYYWI